MVCFEINISHRVMQGFFSKERVKVEISMPLNHCNNKSRHSLAQLIPSVLLGYQWCHYKSGWKSKGHNLRAEWCFICPERLIYCGEVIHNVMTSLVMMAELKGRPRGGYLDYCVEAIVDAPLFGILYNKLHFSMCSMMLTVDGLMAWSEHLQYAHLNACLL